MHTPTSTTYTAPLALLRIATGLLMAYHGWEVFNTTQMQQYAQWDTIKTWPAPLAMVYAGKATELLTGLLLALGLYTRAAALLMAVTMLIICFKLGNGQFWYADQHPFLFALLALVFACTGGVQWSADTFLSSKKNAHG